MSSEKPYIPNYDFGSGELMSWQEMSRTIKDLSAAHNIDGMTISIHTELIAAIRAEISDIKTRLDDLEEQMGRMSPNWLCSEDEAREHDGLDDYPKVYGSIEAIDQWLI